MMRAYFRVNFKRIVIVSVLIFVAYLKLYTEILEVQMPKYGWDSVEHEVFLDLEQLRKGVKIGHVPRYSSNKFIYEIVFHIESEKNNRNLELERSITQALRYQNVSLLDEQELVVDKDSIKYFGWSSGQFIWGNRHNAHLIDNKSGAIGRWKRHYVELLPNENIPPELYSVKISICLYRRHYDFMQ